MIPVKKIVLSLCLILCGVSILSGCTKDEVLDQYNNIVQSTGSIALTGNLSLQGTKEKGIDDYTGNYTADYEDFSDTEYLFGGTSIKREAGKDLSIDCTLEVSEGTAKVFCSSIRTLQRAVNRQILTRFTLYGSSAEQILCI